MSAKIASVFLIVLFPFLVWCAGFDFNRSPELALVVFLTAIWGFLVWTGIAEGGM